MKVRLLGFFMSACASLAAHAVETPLRKAVEASDGWVGYEVPIVAGAGSPCCFAGRHGARGSGGCDLDAREWSFSSDSRALPASDALAVYWHVANGRIDKVRAVAAECPMRSATPIRKLQDVDGQASVAVLSEWLQDREHGKGDVDDVLAAIAWHAGADATRMLGEFSAAGHSRELREQALFWLGQARGRDGAAIVERVATGDADPKLREHAVFALSQAQVDDAYPRVLAIAQRDPDAKVRSQALFWMAQMDDARASTDILAALRSDASDVVKEQAVFALSQLEAPQGDDALIAIMRGDHPRKVKEKALFWLGQSGSQRALDFIDEVLASRSNPPS